jgi:hypothetical protein
VTPHSPPASVSRFAGARISTVYLAVFALCGFIVGARPLNDSSFMTHLRTGDLILRSGIPRHDTYSFTASGTKWIAQSWLAEVLYRVVFDIAGGVGLRLLGGIIGALIGGLLFWLGWKLSQDRVRAGLLAALVFVVILKVWSIRPLIFGVLAMLFLVVIVELPHVRLARRPLIAIPILMWCWTNTHGTFVIGFAYLGLHLIGRALDGKPPRHGTRELQLLYATVVSGVLALVNPYGLDLVLFPVRLMTRGSQVLADVDEWQRPHITELGGFFFALLVITTVVVLVRKRVRAGDWLVAVAFIALGAYAIRNVGLAAIVLLPILARLLRRDVPVPDPRLPIHRIALSAVIAALAFAALFVWATPSWDTARYPVGALRALREEQLNGRRLFTDDGWGGYVILARPDQKVFFDDRYDMYPVAVNVAYERISHAHSGWVEALDRDSVDVVMWRPGTALSASLSKRSEWTQVYADSIAVVFARRSALASRS